MIYTKNVILGMIGIFITIYVILIGLNICTIQTHKMTLEKQVSGIVENALEEGYESKDAEDVIQKLEKELLGNNKKNISLDIKSLDLEKGILSVAVKEEFELITGKAREIAVEKTVIMEKEEMVIPMVKVTFMVDGEIYKEYYLEKGEECPLPKSPSGLFAGWIEYGDENRVYVTRIGAVWEDKIYLAITK